MDFVFPNRIGMLEAPAHSGNARGAADLARQLELTERHAHFSFKLFMPERR